VGEQFLDGWKCLIHDSRRRTTLMLLPPKANELLTAKRQFRSGPLPEHKFNGASSGSRA